ncbi:MAG: CDP-alcohol phosphatidyltransferase family protein [Candidatus Rokubacteria bacterium]|nr:CDP-alcohol phosphatidyltransferase family protein [Candidatus Rokubacteria bacterium]
MLSPALALEHLPAQGVLLVVPDAVGTCPLAPDATVGGLGVLTRLVLAASRAGFTQLLVHDLVAGGEGPPPASGTSAERAVARRRVVLVPCNIVPRRDWLRALLERPVELETLYVDDALVTLVETEQPERVLEVALGAESADAVVAGLRAVFPAPLRALDPDGRFPLRAAGDVARAEAWLLQSLIKDDEGFMSRHFERRLSLAVTRRLMGTRVTPNMMTLVSLGIGLAGAACFLWTDPVYQLAGALLFLAHSILDGCDGELARLKFMESPQGAVLDFWGDNVVHVAVFACMAAGWSLEQGALWPVALGLLAIAGTLGTASVLSGRFLAPTGPPREGGFWARVVDGLAHRDFIYLIVALAAFGKASWFLVLSGIGTPLFLLLVLWTRRPHRV